jgi:hypothetical protein
MSPVGYRVRLRHFNTDTSQSTTRSGRCLNQGPEIVKLGKIALPSGVGAAREEFSVKPVHASLRFNRRTRSWPPSFRRCTAILSIGF